MTIFYLDYVNGSDANNGSSWALAWKTITSGATAARIAPGDIIRIAKSPDPTSLGMTATWTNLSRAVTLDSALTENIDLGEAAWTSSASVTCTTSTTRKEGAKSASIAIAAAFTTGKVAYKAFGATDYSGYQQISFWIRTSAAIAANVLKISLCSDAVGNVIVDDFVIPATSGTNKWTVFTINKGAALGASIQSVALYALLDPGTVTVLLDNVIACKAVGSADSLSLTSLISKNSLAQGGDEGWYGIKSINGTAIELDNHTESGAGTGRGYSGTTETVTTYKRETIKTAIASASTTVVQACQDNGTLGNNIQYQGGWDTGTTIQDGETFFNGLNGNGYALQLSSKNYNTLNYLNFSRYNYGIYFYNSHNNTITTVTNVNNNASYGIYFTVSSNNTITTITNANNNANYGIYFGGSNNNTITAITSANNNNVSGIYFDSSSNNAITTVTNVNNNGLYGICFLSSSNSTITTVTNVNNNASYGIYFDSSSDNAITTVTNVNSNGYGIYFYSSHNNTITTVTNANNNTYGIRFLNSNNNTITTVTNVNNNTSYGIYFTSSYNNTITTITNVNDNANHGIYFYSSHNSTITTITSANNNTGYGIYIESGNNNTIRSLSTTGNTIGGIYNDIGINYVNKAVIAEATKVAGYTTWVNSRIFANNFNNDTNDHRIYTDGGTINSQTAVRHTASGIAWLFNPTSADRQASYPLDLTIAKIAVSANNLVIVKAWFRRDDIGLTMSLVCKGGQINGVPNDVISSMTAIADTWEELTITFTPTEVGVVEILALAYGGTTYSGYVDDLTITQA